MNRFEIEIFRERSFIHHPWQIGDLHASIDDWSGNVKTSSLDWRSLTSREILSPAPEDLGNRRYASGAWVSGACGSTLN